MHKLDYSVRALLVKFITDFKDLFNACRLNSEEYATGNWKFMQRQHVFSETGILYDETDT